MVEDNEPVDWGKVLKQLNEIFSPILDEATEALGITPQNEADYDPLSLPIILKKTKAALAARAGLNSPDLTPAEKWRIVSPAVMELMSNTRGRKTTPDYDWAFMVFMEERIRSGNTNLALKLAFDAMLEHFNIEFKDVTDEHDRRKSFESVMYYRLGKLKEKLTQLFK